MRVVCFKTDLFASPESRPRSERALGYFLDTLYKIDCDYLRDNPQTPFVLKAGVIYQQESYGMPEQWKSIPEVLADGHGDCEDLACWLAACLTVQRGIPARVIWKAKHVAGPNGRFSLYHILVELPSGKLLDPSKALGMKNYRPGNNR